jgi:guanosine-3',5'-bis(diphosphate) 3'-pyrophosphohydrolase
MTKAEESSVLGVRGARHEAASDAFFQEAVSFAARAHRNQLRKDGRTPYVAHVIRVALTVRVVFGCEDAIALQAAILHDTIEDTTTDYEDITERFGEAVAACVAALTKNMALPEHERELEYDARLAKATWQARIVKLADAYDNLCDVSDFSEKDKAKKTADAVERARRALALSAGDVSQASVARARELLARLVGAIER